MASYVTPELYMPSGEMVTSKVLEIVDGCVNKIYSFNSESHGLHYLTQIYLSPVKDLKNLDEWILAKTSICEVDFYAYSIGVGNAFLPLL